MEFKSLNELKSFDMTKIIEIAESLEINNINDLRKHDLVARILKKTIKNNTIIKGSGVLEVLSDGFGFLRSTEANYLQAQDDIYISPVQIRKLFLKNGDFIEGNLKAPKEGEKYFSLSKITNVNSHTLDKIKKRVSFDNLTALYPVDPIKLEIKGDMQRSNTTGRILDIITPIGKGQRSLIVAPPRTGKTIMLQNIANSIAVNSPDSHLIVLLIDERPEEVTDMIRSVKGDVISSTFDEPPTRHVQVAEMVLDRAKRLVENKKDVVILLDSITRLARAYNTVVPSSGKVLTGGVDSNALQRPKRFFGAARNIEEGGSLTIISTALVDTGSRMDEVIFEEFKGTGNSEIILDRKLADKRIFPSVDVLKSGTRKEELLVDSEKLNKMWVLRRLLLQMGSIDSVSFLIEKMKTYKNNDDFFDNMNK